MCLEFLRWLAETVMDDTELYATPVGPGQKYFVRMQVLNADPRMHERLQQGEFDGIVLEMCYDSFVEALGDTPRFYHKLGPQIGAHADMDEHALVFYPFLFIRSLSLSLSLSA